jgi:hypothetical protein
MVAAFVAKAPEITIERGVVCIEAESGDEILQWHMPLFEFQMALARAERVLAGHLSESRVIALHSH